MSQYPLNELKRRLEDNDVPLPKRLRLAKNIVYSQHFPTIPKERIVGEWLSEITKGNKLSGKELKDILSWLDNVDNLTSELKCKLIKVVSQYIRNIPLKNEDIEYIILFLENNKLSTQLITLTDEFLHIVVNLLQHLQNNPSAEYVDKILNGIVRYYKETKKKLEFVIKFLQGDIIETVFSYLNTNSHNTVIHLCKNILFPMSKKAIFASFLNNLIRKDKVDELIAEKGDNIQSVLKIMTTFFTFPSGRTSKDQKFIIDFITVLVNCYKTESQLIFAFYIMTANLLDMKQSYISSAMKMPPIIFEENDDKIKRNIFLNMLNILLNNEIDISVRLTDTLGENVSKVEVKKNFTVFLQNVMMGLLKLTGKTDKVTLEIIKIALKLDPSLIEQKLDIILPYIMITKKSTAVMETYIDMTNYLIETLFKLSRGTNFFNKIIPHIKINLEAINVEQFELKQNLNDNVTNGEDRNKIKSKIISGNDIFPKECVEVYGKLTSNLLFRQNKDMLISLQRDLEENCLMMLEEGFVSPSIITLTEVLAAILSSFLNHSKMADHTVPQNIAEDFWEAIQKFEEDCLKKFGECVLKLSYNPPLILSFLKLCSSFVKLKLLNIKYSNTKLTFPDVNDTLDVADMSVIIPCIKTEQWILLSEKIKEDDALLVWNELLNIKVIAIQLLSKSTNDHITESISNTKTHLVNSIKADVINNCDFKIEQFGDLNNKQIKQLAKTISKSWINSTDNIATINNKQLLQAILLEVAKNILKIIENSIDLNKPLNKYVNNISNIKENDVKEYINAAKLINEEIVYRYVYILKELQIYYLDENHQLIAIFLMLVLKKCCNAKKIRRSIDHILQSIFELSVKYPDLFKLFSVGAIFDFNNKMIIDLLTLNNKFANNMLIMKCVLESAVKKVKTEPDIINNIVEILLKHHKNINNNKLEYFNNSVFQIICIILPLIAKEKRAITTSAYRSILADLQEKLNQAMLESFKNVDFDHCGSLNEDKTSNTDELVEFDNLATLNAIEAYTLTLLKCCESEADVKSLDCLWSGLGYFMSKAVQSIQCKETKSQHVESSLHLLNVVLRYIKKLETHEIFKDKDKLLIQMWKSVKIRLEISFGQKKRLNLEEIGVCLKFLAELSSVECFGNYFAADLANLALLKKPTVILKNEEFKQSQIISRKIAKYLWLQCLKANIIGSKCIALTKIIFRATKNVKFWIQQHYHLQNGRFQDGDVEMARKDKIKVDDVICELLRSDLDILSEVILAAKKISLDYKFMDAIFELLHLILYLMDHTSESNIEISCSSFFELFEGYFSVLNSMLLSREELLEDRWPCYMQCYKTLILRLCQRSVCHQQLDTDVEHKLAEAAHSLEKLTQSICKRKTHVSRISAYAVADICFWLEGNPPPKMVRQHLENSIALLIQASDSNFAMAFLRRALAGSIGQMTMTNMYSMYKRYHKYVGNA